MVVIAAIKPEKESEYEIFWTDSFIML